MFWWAALAVTALGLVFLVWNMWASIYQPGRRISTEERISEIGWATCFLLAFALLIAAVIK